MPPRRSLKPTFAASPLNGGLTRERLLAFSRQRSNTVAGKVTFKVTPASRVVAKARSNAIRSFSEHAASPPSPASSLRPFATKLSSCYYPGGESNKRPYAHSNSCDARIRWNAAPATFAGPSNNDSATDRDVYIKGVSENNRGNQPLLYFHSRTIISFLDAWTRSIRRPIFAYATVDSYYRLTRNVPIWFGQEIAKSIRN